MRVPVSNNAYISASVPACQLLASGFSDSITLHMTSGRPIALSYHVSSSKCAKTAGVEQAQFQTQVRVKQGEEAPRPNLDPHNTGKAAANPGVPVIPAAAEQEQGFFQKYVRTTIVQPSFRLKPLLTANFMCNETVALPTTHPHHVAHGWNLQGRRPQGEGRKEDRCCWQCQKVM